MGFYNDALSKIYSEDDDFLIIGLTGRTGSGCSTVSNILSSESSEIKHSLFNGDYPKSNEERKERVLFKYFSVSWVPFIKIQASSILTLCLSKDFDGKLNKFIREVTGLGDDQRILESTVNDLESILKEIKAKDESSDHDIDDKIKFINEYLIKANAQIKSIFKNKADYIKLYQAIGNNYRSSGMYHDNSFSDEFHGFFLPKKINDIIHGLRSLAKEKNTKTGEKKPIYIVIDAIRNPFEATYFQDRYSSFYLMAVSTEEHYRHQRLREQGLTDAEIKDVDAKEYRKSSLDEKSSYIYQNIQSCLEISDIYVENPQEENAVCRYSGLANQLIKFTSLMKRPGIITPSNVERCMQIAYTAKLNSGCISRQVGAAVSDSSFSIKSIGWNDVPSGQVPCSLRDRFDLSEGFDDIAYSEFEKNENSFIRKIDSTKIIFSDVKSKGMRAPFCFKTEWNNVLDDKYKEDLRVEHNLSDDEFAIISKIKSNANQVFTRSLHAEENAFLQISKYGGVGIQNGFLFTTASPCELCSKKAYQLGIKQIYYIDPYPGIAMRNILNSGSNKPLLKIFNGAIGKAFHNFYTPRMAYKDELSARSRG